MSRKTSLVFGMALLQVLGLAIRGGADDSALERPGFAITTLDGEGGGGGRYTSVTIVRPGLGLISYYDATFKYLKVAHCSNSACTTATRKTLPSPGFGQFSSVTIGTDGLGLISYYDLFNLDLKVAHCSNTFCIPYHRRR